RPREAAAAARQALASGDVRRLAPVPLPFAARDRGDDRGGGLPAGGYRGSYRAGHSPHPPMAEPARRYHTGSEKAEACPGPTSRDELLGPCHRHAGERKWPDPSISRILSLRRDQARRLALVDTAVALLDDLENMADVSEITRMLVGSPPGPVPR